MKKVKRKKITELPIYISKISSGMPDQGFGKSVNEILKTVYRIEDK